MKKVFILVAALAITISMFSQQINPSPPEASNEFFKKSENQKKAGRILLIGGTGLIITSIVIPRGDLVYDGICVAQYCSDEYKNDKIKTIIFISGAASGLASIPFFIASKKNRKKSMNGSAFFEIERIPTIQSAGFVNKSYPAISLMIDF